MQFPEALADLLEPPMLIVLFGVILLVVVLYCARKTPDFSDD
jgi:hypothetical protein